MKLTASSLSVEYPRHFPLGSGCIPGYLFRERGKRACGCGVTALLVDHLLFIVQQKKVLKTQQAQRFLQGRLKLSRSWQESQNRPPDSP